MSIRAGGLFALVVAIGFLLGFAACQRTGTPTNSAPDAPAAASDWFEDVTDAVGLTFTHDCGPTGKFFMPQSVGPGGALFDADGDGRLDILLLQTAGPGSGVRNRLYLQTADGRFRDASAGSGLDFDGYNMGVAMEERKGGEGGNRK